jgi:hypothetical protein
MRNTETSGKDIYSLWRDPTWISTDGTDHDDPPDSLLLCDLCDSLRSLLLHVDHLLLIRDQQPDHRDDGVGAFKRFLQGSSVGRGDITRLGREDLASEAGDFVIHCEGERLGQEGLQAK